MLSITCLAVFDPITGVIGLAIGAVAVYFLIKMLGLKTIKEAQYDADQLREQARIDGQTANKQTELDFREELAKRREQFEAKAAESREKIAAQQNDLTKREIDVDRKLDMLSTKERFLKDEQKKLHDREQHVAAKEAQLDEMWTKHRARIENSDRERKQALMQVSNLSEEDARKEMFKALERECQHESAQIIQRNLDRAEEESRENAIKITLQAIQRYAGEHTADSTVSAVPIPSDDMKGRVIGREGRNIRAFEKATGVDVIVDDTPGVVVVSCFDPVRRAIAAETLRKLIDDGRIHPTRIEEVTEQMTREIGERMVKYGKDACIETNVQGLHPKISETMGRLYYRMSYGQNILRHSVEVAYLCQVIADELGLDGELARRCGFLHDIGKALDHDQEGGHPAIGMEFCRKYKEKEAVLNAIGGHHDDIISTTPYTPIVMAADAISGARPGARRETLERYVKRLEQLEDIATSMKGVQNAYAIQAGREVRVIVDPEHVDDSNCTYLARDIAKRVSEEMTFPGEIKVTVLREMRTVEYAR